jgi:hypothetical protein
MTLDLDAIESAAKAATPGPWRLSDGHGLCVDAGDEMIADMDPASTNGAWEGKRVDATFIALANHASVLALIAEIRALRAGLEEAAAEVLDHQAKLARIYNAMCGAMAWLGANDDRSETEAADIDNIRAEMHAVFTASPGVLYQAGPGAPEALTRIAALRELVKP